MVPPGEGNEARGDGRRGVGVSHSTAEAGELSPRDPVEGRGHRQVAPVEGKTANTPRLGPVSTSRQRIAELARQALGMAVAIAWLPGPAGTRRRVAKPSVEEPDAAEPARPDLWGARVSNDPGLPDLARVQSREPLRGTRSDCARARTALWLAGRTSPAGWRFGWIMGSQYLSDHFLKQIRYWGVHPSFGFVEEPETNGVAERRPGAVQGCRGVALDGMG